MKILAAGLCGVLLATVAHAQSSTAATPCERLASVTLPNTTITLAQLVEAGAFTPPAPASGAPAGGGPVPAAAAQALRELPAFCRVAATLTPSSDSDIKIEVWMPASGWNGKFQAVGNGGWAGTISYLVPDGRSRARCEPATRPRPPTPGTLVAAGGSRWATPRRSSISGTARCTR